MASHPDSIDDPKPESGLRPVRQDLDLGNLQLGKYRILGEVGRGGMADVYLAVAQGLSGFNKLVVLKVIRAEVAEDPDARAMFVNEARLAGRLNHPNVVHTLEVGEEAGRPILVMEHLDGQPLNAVMRRCRRDNSSMPMHMALRVLAESLQGLHYAHTLKDFDGTALRLVHRDVSPQNIFVTYDGQIKMLDFGIAKAATTSSETRAGIMKGKAAYMAPEQVSGESIDHRADIYSTGVVLWQLLTGQQWWKGKPQGQILLTVLNGDVPKPSAVCESVDPDLEAICTKAMEVDPDKRFQTALEMHNAIEAALDARPPASTRDVGAFVAGLFEDERETLGRTLETELRSFSESGHHRSRNRTFSSPSVDDSQGSIRSVNTDSGALEGRAPAPEQKRRGAAIAIVALGLVVVAGVGWIVLRTPPKVVVATTEVASAVATPVTTPEPVLSAAQLPTSQPASSCTFLIKAIPKNATIALDGAVLKGNPVSTQVVQDGKAYMVRVEAPGFTSRTVEVTAARDAEFVIELDAIRAGGGAVRRPPEEPPSPTAHEPPPPPPTKPPPPKEDPKNARDRIKDLDTSSPW